MRCSQEGVLKSWNSGTILKWKPQLHHETSVINHPIITVVLPKNKNKNKNPNDYGGSCYMSSNDLAVGIVA